jgi:transcriptional regulator with XRE-family HTH domain
MGSAFGKVVSEARIARGLSGRDLAQRADLDRRFLLRIERGDASPTLTDLFKIARALDVNPSELVARADRILKKGRR